MVTKLISALAVAAVASLTVTTANAGHENTATVKAGDLDLSKAADVQMLYARVQEAANDACRREAHRHYQSTRLAAPVGWRERCVKETVESAVRGIADPRLAALHE